MSDTTIRLFCYQCQKSFSLICKIDNEGVRLLPTYTECPMCGRMVKLRDITKDYSGEKQ